METIAIHINVNKFTAQIADTIDRTIIVVMATSATPAEDKINVEMITIADMAIGIIMIPTVKTVDTIVMTTTIAVIAMIGTTIVEIRIG